MSCQLFINNSWSITIHDKIKDPYVVTYLCFQKGSTLYLNYPSLIVVNLFIHYALHHRSHYRVFDHILLSLTVFIIERQKLSSLSLLETTLQIKMKHCHWNLWSFKTRGTILLLVIIQSHIHCLEYLHFLNINFFRLKMTQCVCIYMCVYVLSPLLNKRNSQQYRQTSTGSIWLSTRFFQRRKLLNVKSTYSYKFSNYV